jgi:hypothetical protein
MKIRALILFTCILLFPHNASGPQSKPTVDFDTFVWLGPVNDFAHVLSPKTVQEIKQGLPVFLARTSVNARIITLDPKSLVGTTGIGDAACRFTQGIGFQKDRAMRSVAILLVKGKGAEMCATNDIKAGFENTFTRSIFVDFIRPAVLRGDMDSAAMYGAAALTVLLAPVTPTDGGITRASAKPGYLFQEVARSVF